MADKNAEILEAIEKKFAELNDADGKIRKFGELLDAGKTTQNDLMNYSRTLGENLSESFISVFGSDVLPDETVVYKVANKTIKPMMRKAHETFSEKAVKVQKAIDEANGIGLNAVTTKYNDRRINGIISLMTKADVTFAQQEKLLGEPIVNICMSFYDDFVHENAAFRWKAGMKEKVVRRAARGCCKWCNSLEGVYDYDKVGDTGNNVFRRHQRCRCSLTFYTDGFTQDAWSKEKFKSDSGTLDMREVVGLEDGI